MRKKEERQLMRQKVNISEVLIESWKANYLHDIRNMIHPSMMEETDLGTTFEHQNRHFEIIGLTISGTLMLRETREEGIFYWEATRSFVQMKLGRLNKEFYKVAGKLQTREIPYQESKLYLAPLNHRIKKEEQPEVDNQYVDSEDDDAEIVTSAYVEESYDDIQSED